jgi:type II secretory pathway pseudopilin PulG
MKFPKLRLCNNSGLTLVETTIVLAVVSVIIAAVWMVSSVVYENARQYQANRQMQTIVQNVRQLYARVNALSTFADVTATMDSQLAFPIEMRLAQGTASDKLNHPWGQASTGTVRIYNRTSTTFGIVFTAVPKQACIGLATKLSGGEISNLSSFKINSSTYSGTGLPVTIVTANGGSQCGAGNSNTLEWIFEIRA